MHVFIPVKNILNLESGDLIFEGQYITAPLDVLSDSRLKRVLKKYIFRSDTTSNPFLSTSIFVVAQKLY